jgi:hypothetical protein
MSRRSGQASIELVAALPALMLAALIAFQLLATGYSLALADGAAEAGAFARAAGEDPEEAARAAMPGWAEDRVKVEAVGGRIAVELLPPSPLPGLGEVLSVSSTAWVRPDERK